MSLTLGPLGSDHPRVAQHFGLAPRRVAQRCFGNKNRLKASYHVLSAFCSMRQRASAVAARSVYRAPQIAALSARARGAQAFLPSDNPMPPCPPPLDSTFCHHQQKADQVAAAMRRQRPVQKSAASAWRSAAHVAQHGRRASPWRPLAMLERRASRGWAVEPQRGPADQKSFRQENDGAQMAFRDLRASQGTVVNRYYPILHRGIRARVIACERADERSSERPHGRQSWRARENRWWTKLADCAKV